jgi:hypothetical protein
VISTRKRAGVSATVAALALTVAAAASADRGNWTADAFGGSYQGACTDVFVQDGLLLACHGKLVSGSPVNETTRVASGNCLLVLTPSGVADQTCKP